jgi:diaminopimelate decarboxylase
MTLLDHLPSLRHVGPDRFDRAVWPSTSTVDSVGRLCVGGVPLTNIADEFGTPSYVIDEADFRSRIRRYRSALPGVRVVYAGKSLLTTTVARWVAEEGLGLDVCSAGELAIALAAGVDPARIVMHGNAKTIDELRGATTAGIGRIVVDSLTELSHLACLVRRPQRVLLRVTPDVDIHGHHAVNTGVADQKFGFTLDDGQFSDAVGRIAQHRLLTLVGLHCHLGSQITDATLYGEAIRRLVPAMADIQAHRGVTLGELNIGGGHGVPYLAGDPELELRALSAVIADALNESCAVERFPRPTIVVEPGRAISARAGVTVYRVVSLKTRPGGRTFVAVDGGMSDNPRVALYGAKYSVALVNRHALGPVKPVTIVGRHCEAGDELARDVLLPEDLHSGDVLAFAGTGAYNHSMASTYNTVCRPPLVAVHDGDLRELVRREAVADLLSRDRGAPEVRPPSSRPRSTSGCAALLHGE